MSRKRRKKRKGHQAQAASKRLDSQLFDLEDDAESLFLEYLENDPGLEKAISEKKRQESSAKLLERKKQNASKQMRTYKVDLHGMRVIEAKERIQGFLAHLPENAKSEAFRLRVVTGKGRHSGPEGGVLVDEIYRFVAKKFKNNIIDIDEAPAKLKLGELPLRGHFDVILKL